MLRVLLLTACLSVALLGSLACGSGPDLLVDEDRATSIALVPIATISPTERYMTATPWPTFTPVASATRVLRRSAFESSVSREEKGVVVPVSPTLLPTSVPIPLPTISPTRILDIEEFIATPTPAPLQLVVPDTDVQIQRQSVFMSQFAGPPGFWPRSDNVFYTRTARYIGWYIKLDYSDVGDDFSMDGLVRWLNMSSGDEHVILQEHYSMDASLGDTLFFMIGNDEPGFWFPGKYRVELWDNRDRVVVYFEFIVKSGTVG